MTGMDRQTELALVEGLRSGDRAAFDRVYEAFRAPLFSFLLRLSRRRTVAEDLLDETWLRFVANARSLRPDTNLAAWLFTVARNRYRSYRRACILEEALDPGQLGFWPAAESWPSPYEAAVGEETERRLELALAALPARHRETLLLVAGAGLTPQDAAVVCGVTPEAFRQRLARARAALAEQLAETPGRVAPTPRYAT